MRRLWIFLVLFLVTISVATGVHASTECEKWLTEYKNSLAHSPAAHRIKAAHRRLHHYIHHRLAILKKPAAPKKPRLLPAHHSRPKMTREELLKKLELACGDLPGENPKLGELKKTDPVEDFISGVPDDEPVELASNDSGLLLPGFPPPVYAGAAMPPDGSPPGFFVPPIVGGSPKTPNSPNTPPPSCDAQSKILCQPGGGDQPPPVVTPEPGTLVLILTGVPGMAGFVRRKYRRAA